MGRRLSKTSIRTAGQAALREVRTALVKGRFVLGWVVLGLVGCAFLHWGFRPLFPLYPEEWRISRQEAEAISLERLRDLDPSVGADAVIAHLEVDGVLERRLLQALESASAEQAQVLRRSALADRVLYWSVTTFAPGAEAGEWRNRAKISSGGRVWALEKRVPVLEGTAGGEIFPGEARLEADQFLDEQGFDLANFSAPVAWRRTRSGATRSGETRSGETRSTRIDIELRYQREDGILDDDIPYGIEVGYAGGVLQGFRTWMNDPQAETVGRQLRTWQVTSVARTLLVVPLLMLVVACSFRSDGERHAGMRSRWKILCFVLVAGGFSVLTAVHSATEGWVLGGWSRQQIGWAWALAMLALYLPTLGLLGFLSFSAARLNAEWERRLEPLHAIVDLRWSDSAVGASCLRGTAAGLFVSGALVALTALLHGPMGVWTQVGFLIGPWWQHGRWPGPALAAFVAALCLSQLIFALVFVLPLAIRGLGLVSGGTVVAVLLGITMGPPLETMPIALAFPLWILSGAVAVLLFMRYDFLCAVVASIVSIVAVAALPWLFAQDSTLQAQGWFAIALAVAPLVASVRFVGASSGNDEYHSRS